MDFINLEPGCYEVDIQFCDVNNIDCFNIQDKVQIDNDYQVHPLSPQDNGSEDDIAIFKRDENGNFYLHIEKKDDTSQSLDLHYIESSNDKLLFAGTDENGAKLQLELKKSGCKV